MQQIDEAALAAYLDKYIAARWNRLLLNRCFQGTVQAVNLATVPFTVLIQRIGESVMDSTPYACPVPGYLPAVGDRVELIWRDNATAEVLAPLTALYGSGPLKIDEQILTLAPGVTIPPTGSLPQWGRHLEIEYVLRGDTATLLVELGLQFNQDGTGGHYGSQRDQGNAAVALSSEEATGSPAAIGLVYITAASAAVNWAGIGKIWIPLYAGTTNGKLADINWAAYGQANAPGASGQLYTGKTTGLWASVANITSVRLFAFTGQISGTVTTRLYP